jgi:hypothetical protein
MPSGVLVGPQWHAMIPEQLLSDDNNPKNQIYLLAEKLCSDLKPVCPAWMKY